MLIKYENLEGKIAIQQVCIAFTLHAHANTPQFIYHHTIIHIHNTGLLLIYRDKIDYYNFFCKFASLS